MKKIILLAAGFLIAGTVANAQTSTTSGSVGSTKWGLKVGVNLAKYSYGADDAENPETDHATNFHVTGYLDLPLGGMFSVQPGLSLQGKGAEFFDSGDTEVKDNTMWLEVPVNLVGKIPLGATGTSLFLGAGPYAAYGISGERKITFDDEGNDRETIKQDLKFGNDDEDDFKALDFGVNFLGGIQLNNGFNIGAGYGLGLTDLLPSGDGGDGQLTNRVLSFSVGYSF
ncbi:porin family protein [Paradesertivirga mongoliensis]|uniref:Porin family protein n=1 Tax=Paradesertivirga mongoliensis TaxID=2100740 RepID=A0ABW4ZLX7_9SPHI|nr:porin family protein [Pedobacter mongoliensis]